MVVMMVWMKMVVFGGDEGSRREQIFSGMMSWGCGFADERTQSLMMMVSVHL